nr:MAG TPA: hypothetical protein [Caudoviricetes sp.]
MLFSEHCFVLMVQSYALLVHLSSPFLLYWNNFS